MNRLYKKSRLFIAILLILTLTACSAETQGSSSKNGSLNDGSSYDSASSNDASGEGDEDPFKTPDGLTDDDIEQPFEDGYDTPGSTSSAGKTSSNSGSKSSSATSSKSGVVTEEKKKIYGESGDTSFSVPVTGLQKNTVYSVSTSALLSFSGTKIMSHDLVRLFVSVQGLINRDYEKNKIALILTPTAEYQNFWIDYISKPGTVLDGTTTVKITSFEVFLNTFKDVIKECGMVLWDPAVPSTANVAATICGLDGYIPVKYDQNSNGLKSKLEALGVKTKLSLVNRFSGKGIIPGTKIASSGSAKCDAYLWALDKYMNRCSTKYIAYMPDGASCVDTNIIYKNDIDSRDPFGVANLVCHDYLLARRAFFFDTSPVGSEVPCDDLTQPIGTDLKTMQKILTVRYEMAEGKFAELIGFVPWQIKYTTHNNWGSIVDTAVEAMHVSECTKYNCYLDVSFNVSNTSIYYKYKAKESYTNGNKTVTEVYDPNTYYLYYHIGDYDATGWALEYLWAAYEDPLRGTFPITWAINPCMSDRIPMLFDYLYTNKSANDTFSASDSGVGYFRPTELFPNDWEVDARELPAGDKQLAQASIPYFKRFDMDVVSFVIGGMGLDQYKMYNQFAPKGTFHNDRTKPLVIYDGVPYVPTMNGIGVPGDYNNTARRMYDFLKSTMPSINNGKPTNVLAYRTIRWKPSELKQMTDAFIAYAKTQDSTKNYKFVNAYTLLEMAKQSGQATIINK